VALENYFFNFFIQNEVSRKETIFNEAKFEVNYKPKLMKPLFFLNVNLLFSIQLAVMLMGAVCIIYLVYKIWKKR
jgi:hypothetical protein